MALAFALLTLAVYAWALWARPESLWLRNYLLAQSLATPLLFLAWRVLGYNPAYVFIYAALTMAVILCAAALAIDYLASPQTAIVAASGFFCLAFWIGTLHDTPVPSGAQSLQLFYGGMLILSGVMIGLSSVGRRDPLIPLSLSFLWITQGLFHGGVVSYWDNPAWIEASKWVPGIIVALAGLWLGTLIRWEHRWTVSRG